MRRYSWLVALALVFAVLRPAMSAPMFPDVPDMWAKDAVGALAAKGILEGYPDGTFKGDRAATRYEVAMIVARLMAKMEQEHATFATKADLDELRRLVNQLKDELDALGVRVQNLEDNVAKLDKRVTELERITFYGSLDVRYVSNRVQNTGLSTGTSGTDPGVSVVTANQAGTLFTTGVGGIFPTATGIAGGAGPNPITTIPSLLAAIAALGARGGNFIAGGSLVINPFGPGAAAPAGSLAVAGTTGITAPVPGIGTSFSVGLTGVGIPAAFISGNAPGLPAALAGHPVFINEFRPNTSSFNTDSLSTAGAPLTVGSANPSYNLVVGSNRSLGGNAFATTGQTVTLPLAGTSAVSAPVSLGAQSPIAIGGNPFWGLTGMVGVTSATPMVIPTFEFGTGRAWTNGQGFSGQGILGVRIKLNPDMDAGAEFAAYYATGDPIVDAFFGVSPVRPANVFGSNQGLGANSGPFNGLGLGANGSNLSSNPWSTMVLDNFWFVHKPSGIKVQIGSYGQENMDSIVYQPEANPNYFGPKYLDNYGFRVSGKNNLLAPFEWEVFGSSVADGNRLLTDFSAAAAATGAQPYHPYLWGVDGKWTFGQEGNQGHFKFDILRIWDDNAGGGATTVGSIVGVNGVWLDWANPNGFYAAQLSPQWTNSATAGVTVPTTAGKVAGFGSTSDVRPIIPNIAGNGFGINPTTKAPVGGVFGIDQTGSGALSTITEPLLAALGSPVATGAPTSSFGPQSMFTWGASGGWDFTWNDNVKMRFNAEYANSTYKPSDNSSYTSPQGTALKVGLGFTLFSDFDLGIDYLNVNPYYNPYVLQYPYVNGVTQDYWRFPNLSWFPEMYPVSDKDEYPDNRQGFKLKFKWNPVDPKDGKHKTVAWAEYGNMQQNQSSLQSIRYSPGSISQGNIIPGTGTGGVPAAFDPNSMIPNGFVLGNMPGFVDTVFTGFSPLSFKGYTGSLVSSPSNQFASPLENPTGRITNWGIGLNYRFDTLGGLGIHAGYKDWQFSRPSGLTPQFGGSENNINLHLNGGLVALSYPINERFSIKGGYQWGSVYGHYDPTGIYQNFALDTGNINFQTLNEDQSVPFVGFDYDIARNVNWNMTAKWLTAKDNLGTFSTPNFFNNRNPFSWSGLQLTSELKVSF